MLSSATFEEIEALKAELITLSRVTKRLPSNGRAIKAFASHHGAKAIVRAIRVEFSLFILATHRKGGRTPDAARIEVDDKQVTKEDSMTTSKLNGVRQNLQVGVPLFAPLPTVDGGWACVHADPPWRYRSNSSANPGRNVMRHYGCLSLDEIASLPVKDVVAAHAFAFLWVPGAFLVTGGHIPILHSWGFRPTAMGFVWLKLRRNASDLFIDCNDIFTGTGLTTRKNCEFVVIGKRGHPKRAAADVGEAVFGRVREPSRKPDEIYRRIERFCEGARLDLFTRETRANWTPFGDEVGKFDPPTISRPLAELTSFTRTEGPRLRVMADPSAQETDQHD
jgi:N6-adenosine-specific RNA methylase IME4